jgi:hypothetical protein
MRKKYSILFHFLQKNSFKKHLLQSSLENLLGVQKTIRTRTKWHAQQKKQITRNESLNLIED